MECLLQHVRSLVLDSVDDISRTKAPWDALELQPRYPVEPGGEYDTAVEHKGSAEYDIQRHVLLNRCGPRLL